MVERVEASVNLAPFVLLLMVRQSDGGLGLCGPDVMQTMTELLRFLALKARARRRRERVCAGATTDDDASVRHAGGLQGL